MSNAKIELVNYDYECDGYFERGYGSVDYFTEDGEKVSFSIEADFREDDTSRIVVELAPDFKHELSRLEVDTMRKAIARFIERGFRTELRLVAEDQLYEYD